MTQPTKEIKKLIQKKLIDSPLSIENRLPYLEEKIAMSIEPGKKRFKKLIKSIDVEFPPKSPIRGAMDGIAAVTFDTAFELYFTGNNSALLIELQGILERFCNNALCDLLPIDNLSQKVIVDSFEKKTLMDFAPYFKQLEIWDENDVKFALRLTSIRNGIAHKNALLVSKYLNDGKQKHFSSIHEITSKTDCIHYIIETLKLILKASKAAEPSFIRNPRLKARYERYISLIGPIYNMFCYPEFLNLPIITKELSLNDSFAPIFLIAGKDLSDELIMFKSNIILFHKSLNENESEAKRLYEGLSDSANKITILMREELKIDADKNIFNEPKLITVQEIKELKTKLGKK
jgi:hypothetical protein